jgi:hypothetical protein
MPRSAHGVDRLVCDCLLAPLALIARGLHVALFAVRVPVVLVVARVCGELGVARPAGKVVVVPGLIHRANASLEEEGINVVYARIFGLHETRPGF